MAVGGRLMRHARDRALGGALASIAWICVACGQGNGGANCLPEDVERCACGDGRAGFMICDPRTSSGYGACNCELDASPYLPAAGLEAGEGDGAASAGDGGLAFLSACSTAAGSPQCPAGTSCDDFPAKGPHCSRPCRLPTDCPAPSPGCNMMGVCKAP